MIRDIQDEVQLRTTAKPHLDKIRINNLFLNVDTVWSGSAASDLADLMESMAAWMDETGVPKIIEARFRRDMARNGQAVMATPSQFLASVRGDIDILRAGSRPGLAAAFDSHTSKQIGNFIEDMISRICHLIPEELKALREETIRHGGEALPPEAKPPVMTDPPDAEPPPGLG